MRREATYTVKTEGRDKGKAFLITEMPAEQGEEWAYRALSALARSGVQLPPNMVETDESGELKVGLGMGAIATLTFQMLAGLPWGDAKPLLDEMMGCVKIVVDPSKPDATTRALIGDDIEEIATRMALRREVFKLHTDFFTSAVRLGSPSGTSQSQTADS